MLAKRDRPHRHEGVVFVKRHIPTRIAADGRLPDPVLVGFVHVAMDPEIRAVVLHHLFIVRALEFLPARALAPR